MGTSKRLHLLLAMGILVEFSYQYCITNDLDKEMRQQCEFHYYDDYCKIVMIAVTFSIHCTYAKIDSIHTTKNSGDIKQITITEGEDSKISSGAFHNFENLTDLVMETGEVDDVEPGAFNGILNIERLTLTTNKISKLSKGVFNSLTKLKSLNLSSNLIQEVESNAFLGMKSLHSLSLSHNNISNITELLNVCNKLATLDLSHNQIRNLISFGDFESLNDLMLNDNKMIEINDRAFQNTPIAKLDISSNLISNISKDAFKNMKHLQHLNLACNELFDLEDKKLPMQLFRDNALLQHLNLSSTGLSQISVGTFTGLENLRVLDLSHNNLRFLSKGVLHEVTSSLSNIYINDNFFINFEYEAIAKLAIINLNANLWHCDTLSIMIQKANRQSIVRGSSFNTTNIFGISCSEDSQQNETVTRNETKIISADKPEFEIEKYIGICFNSSIDGYRDFLGEVRGDLEAIYKVFSQEFLNIFKSNCNSCAPKHDDRSAVNLKPTQSDLTKRNPGEDVQNMSKIYTQPQRLQSQYSEVEKVYYDYGGSGANIILLCILLVLILILSAVIVNTCFNLKLLKEFKKKQQQCLIESANL